MQRLLESYYPDGAYYKSINLFSTSQRFSFFFFFFYPFLSTVNCCLTDIQKAQTEKKKDFPVSTLHLIRDSKGEPAVVPGRRLCSLKAASGELRSKLSSVAPEKRKQLVSGTIKRDGAQGKVGSPAPRLCKTERASDSGRSSPARFSITDTMAAAKFTLGDVLFNMLSLIHYSTKELQILRFSQRCLGNGCPVGGLKKKKEKKIV